MSIACVVCGEWYRTPGRDTLDICPPTPRCAARTRPLRPGPHPAPGAGHAPRRRTLGAGGGAVNAPKQRCRCARAYELCPACRRWAARTPAGQHHTYRGIPRRTWATPVDVQEMRRLRGLGYRWCEIVAVVGVTSGALRAVRRFGLLEDTP
jgi:hypothetical protein